MNDAISDVIKAPSICVRQCNECKGNMQDERKEVEASGFPWRDRYARFICDNCTQEVLIAEPVTIISAMCTGLIILSIQLYALMNGFLDFIVYSFSTTIGFKLLAIFLGFLFILFSIGAGLNLKNGIVYLLKRQAHPVLKTEGNLGPLVVALFLGVLPWIFAVSLGYINYQLLDDNKLFGFLMLPVIASPVFLAPKFNVTYIAVFLSSAFWAGIGGLAVWMF